MLFSEPSPSTIAALAVWRGHPSKVLEDWVPNQLVRMSLSNVIVDFTTPVVISDGVIRGGISENWQIQLLASSIRAMASLSMMPSVSQAVISSFSPVPFGSGGVSGRGGVICDYII